MRSPRFIATDIPGLFEVAPLIPDPQGDDHEDMVCRTRDPRHADAGCTCQHAGGSAINIGRLGEYDRRTRHRIYHLGPEGVSDWSTSHQGRNALRGNSVITRQHRNSCHLGTGVMTMGRWPETPRCQEPGCGAETIRVDGEWRRCGKCNAMLRVHFVRGDLVHGMAQWRAWREQDVPLALGRTA